MRSRAWQPPPTAAPRVHVAVAEGHQGHRVEDEGVAADVLRLGKDPSARRSPSARLDKRVRDPAVDGILTERGEPEGVFHPADHEAVVHRLEGGERLSAVSHDRLEASGAPGHVR